MIKSRPFYLKKKIPAAFITAVYVHIPANDKLAMNTLHGAISKHLNKHPESIFTMAGDFDHFNF